MKPLFFDLPAHERTLTLSTVLTLGRIALTPLIAYLILNAQWTAAGSLFLCAAVSDFLDGFLARHFNQVTLLGACLDALADKALILSCFGALAYSAGIPLVPVWFFLVIVGKDMILVLGTIGIYAFTGRLKVTPTILGKGAMALEVLFLWMVFGVHIFQISSSCLYYIFYALVICVCLSFLQYCFLGYHRLHTKGIS